MKKKPNLIVGVVALCHALDISQTVFYRRVKSLAEKGIVWRHATLDVWCSDLKTIEQVRQKGKL